MTTTTTTIQMPSTKTIISAAATVLLIKSIAKDYIPPEIKHYLNLKLRHILKTFSSEMTIVIQEYENLNQNHLFKAAVLYLEQKIPKNIERLKLSRPPKQNNISVSLLKSQEIIDTFNGVTLKWKLVSRKLPNMQIRTENTRYHLQDYDLKFFELSFHKKNKNMVLDTYLKHVIEEAKELSAKTRALRLFTLKQNGRRGGGRYDMWQSVNLDHPATFDTLAMETEVKRTIMEDLDRFVKRREFYRKVGKAWKRGYLLFGPPGTGKSSLIAAIANHLHFDIYDLELTEVRSNCELRKMLISTANRSILVLEDIDCSIELQDRLSRRARLNPRPHRGYQQTNQVTLSGFLNFIDGLWSSCGDERIIIFTTNYKEKIDPALLRPGRMDVHVHMSYCTPRGIKLLASNYHGITEHPLLIEVEELLKETKVTPAEVGEQLMRSEEPEIAFRGLVDFLQSKKRETDEAARKKELTA